MLDLQRRVSCLYQSIHPKKPDRTGRKQDVDVNTYRGDNQAMITVSGGNLNLI